MNFILCARNLIKYLIFSQQKDLKIKSEELSRLKEEFEKFTKTLKDKEKNFENEIFQNSQNKLSKLNNVCFVIIMIHKVIFKLKSVK